MNFRGEEKDEDEEDVDKKGYFVVILDLVFKQALTKYKCIIISVLKLVNFLLLKLLGKAVNQYLLSIVGKNVYKLMCVW